MKILTLNCGSSSVKYALVEMPRGSILCHGIAHRLMSTRSFIQHFNSGNEESNYHSEGLTYESAIKTVISFLTSRDTGVIDDVSQIDAIGHRVVHGGETFAKPVLINDYVMKKISQCSELAPLHNPANLAGIEVVVNLLPGTPNVAIFDTAFFTTIPPYVYIYALPYAWYEKYGVRKYGFHGSSHSYVSRRAVSLLGLSPHDVNVITLHIGNGVSITAVKEGKAFDHSMGFTPLEGAVMGTRCGDIDPAIPLHIMRKESLGLEELENILNRESGLLGISGKYIDRRDILRAMEAGDERARLSFEIECYRLRKYVGAYAAGMGGVDALVFTGGVGENSFAHRSKICEGLQFIGINIDSEKNRRAKGGETEAEISAQDSRVRIFVIPTNEELVFAQAVFELFGNHCAGDE